MCVFFFGRLCKPFCSWKKKSAHKMKKKSERIKRNQSLPTFYSLSAHSFHLITVVDKHPFIRFSLFCRSIKHNTIPSKIFVHCPSRFSFFFFWFSWSCNQKKKLRLIVYFFSFLGLNSTVLCLVFNSFIHRDNNVRIQKEI